MIEDNNENEQQPTSNELGNENYPNNNDPNNEDKGQSFEESIGIDSNTAALLCYLFLLVGGIIFYILEKKDPFVRFAAMQSILLGSTIFGLLIILRTFQFLAENIFDFLTLILAIGSVIIWIMLMFKAFNNQEWELPIIGKIARNVISK